MSNLFKQIANDLIKSGVLKLVANLMGSMGWGGSAPTVPGHARGGTITSGLAMVGERGPELISAPGSHVFTNQQTRDIMSKGGSNGGRSVVEIRMSKDVESRVVNKANDNAIQFVRNGIKDYNDNGGLNNGIESYNKEPKKR